MKLLDLIFKTEKPESEVLVDDIISNEQPKTKKNLSNSRIDNNYVDLSHNNINVYSPQNQSEVEKIVLNLQKNEASIINLKGFEKVSYIKILDFLSGAVFALNGNISRLTNDLYLISPQNIRIKVLK
ncbi:MAG: cell division protein SepF [Christensenellales bacterium]